MINNCNGWCNLRSHPRRAVEIFSLRLLKHRFSWVVAALLCLFMAGVSAQDTVTGAFQGDVSDNQTTNALPGVAVRITSVERGVVYELITDSQGRFYQGLLAPGFYDISVTLTGYKPQLLRREIKVSRTGDIIPVPVSLEPEPPGVPVQPPPTIPEPAEDVRVEINTADARRDGSYREEAITRLPLGATTVTRSFDELALLLPGVAPPPQTIGDVAGPGVGPGVGSAGQFAVNGLRSRANNFTVDGSDNNDEDIGVRRQGFVALVPQPIESIKEFQVITLLAPAQFGRNIGAQVNAVSKNGGNDLNGSIYGFFNSKQLNARNFFDTASGTDTFAVRTAAGQPVLLDGQPLTVRNQSGGEDSFTFGQGGGTLGGAIRENRLFYFVSGEFQKINASREKNFAVPTVEQRGAFRSGGTGINRDVFNPLSQPGSLSLFPSNEDSAAIFSLFPYANNPNGIYGENTFTQVLPASGRGTILSGRLDNNFELGGKPQSITGRYNFTDDERNIPSVNEAIFSTVLSKIRTHNFSFFFNSQIKDSTSGSRIFNQARFSFGRTRLNFDEVRDSEFLLPSFASPNTPFLLNARMRLNRTLPTPAGGVPTSVTLTSTIPTITGLPSVESTIGPVGQVIIAGFSPLGADVYNFPQTRVNNTFQLADELTWRIGDHSAVFGVDTRRTDLNSDLPRLSRPLFTFNGTPRLRQRTAQNPCTNGGIGNFCFPAAGDPFQVIRPEDVLGLGAASNSLMTYFVGRPDAQAKLRFYQLNFYGQDTWRIKPNLSLSFGLRYEYNTPVKEVDGLIEDTFADPLLQSPFVSGLNRFIDGRTRLYEPDRNNFAPRLGLAYSPDIFSGNRVSVFRFGYGLFYDQILGAVVSQSRNVFPTYLTVNLGGGQNDFGIPELTDIFNPARPLQASIRNLIRPGTVNVFTGPPQNFEDLLLDLLFGFPGAITATLPARNLDMPMAHHYSFAFEQQLNRNFTVSAAYVGTKGKKLLRFTTPNNGPSLTVAPTSIIADQTIAQFPRTRAVVFAPNRAEPTIGAVNVFETAASSTYHSLQTQLRGRFLNDLSFQMSYTFAKATDDVSDVFDLAGAYSLPQNSFDFAAERGPANFDVRHRVAYDLIYSFGKSEGSGFINRLTDNLQIATTGRFHSGQPFTVNSTIDVNLDGNLTDRLNITTGIEETGDRSQPLRLTTSNTVSLLAPFGQDGQIGRNSFRAGSVLELDVSVIKQFVFGSQNLAFRTDIFNFIDRANFGVPVRLLEAPGFGRATSTVTPGRRIQFSLKYEF